MMGEGTGKVFEGRLIRDDCERFVDDRAACLALYVLFRFLGRPVVTKSSTSVVVGETLLLVIIEQCFGLIFDVVTSLYILRYG